MTTTTSNTIAKAFSDRVPKCQRTYTSPLHTRWTLQPVCILLEKIEPGEPLCLLINGNIQPFQYTGQVIDGKTQVMVLLAMEQDELYHLAWYATDETQTDLVRRNISTTYGAQIGRGEMRMHIASPKCDLQSGDITGPWEQVSSYPMPSWIHCDKKLESMTLEQCCDGPLFTDYQLRYCFAEHRQYTVDLRFWAHESIIEVHEHFSLGMHGSMRWTMNPQQSFNAILSRDSFEGETQPTVELLKQDYVDDLICRLQMPVLSEYFIPNNRGWFALLNTNEPTSNMFGIVGLSGGQWQEPVANMPCVKCAEGQTIWEASLASGSRHYLLHIGAQQTQYTPEKRLVYHRLHAQFNACRLDEHLDLSEQKIFDESCWDQQAIFNDLHQPELTQERISRLSPLQRTWDQICNEQTLTGNTNDLLRLLVNPTPEHGQLIYQQLVDRFSLWVRQFQGYRQQTNDYAKNVIGFSRKLRGMLMSYELLRKIKCLSQEQIITLNHYFVFAARRITDLGRWPHTRTALHPDHPQSVRDLYTYGGEHKPDRLYWTNSLPNFQSDPLCALLHISCLFKDHPDAPAWQKLAMDDLDSQLDAYIGKSGAWVESINYTLYTLSYMIITFRAVRYRLDINYFEDERVRRMMGWLVDYFGLKDKRFDAWTWPGVGNAVLPQNQGEYLLAYASELAADDPLAQACMAVYQCCESNITLREHYICYLAATATVPKQQYLLPVTQSKLMDEVGVSMRHQSRTDKESYLFQKIGFAKDHYEADESAFNWYAKGTPLCMDYGTYQAHSSTDKAHNLVEIPDADTLRRGYLKAHHFTPFADFTHCQIPVTLKLLWGHVRSFEELDKQDGLVQREKTPYYYIGDKNPVGPKVWKVRLLLFIKPDYIAIFDRVYGEVPHRWNLHVTGDSLVRDGQLLHAMGQYDLDLQCLVQHPKTFELQTGYFQPKAHHHITADALPKHAQNYWRLYNREDGIYRTLLFAREKERDVKLTAVGQYGMKVQTHQFTDYVFLHDEVIHEKVDDVVFHGRQGWIRQTADGQIQAMLIDGQSLQAFGCTFSGVGPWIYNSQAGQAIELLGGPPRRIQVV